MESNAWENSRVIKELAIEFGFLECGITRVRRLDEEEAHLDEWISRGYHGSMYYMEKNREMRLNPGLIMPEAVTVVSMLYNYYPGPDSATHNNSLKIARYAYGEDYHYVIREKLHLMLKALREKVGPVKGRVFTDSAPVMERQWAQEAGLGWTGKNTLLLNKRFGSYFFLAEMLIDLECAADQPVQTDHCGTCTACIDACPTQAILPGKILNASECISYLTIEHKEAIPDRFEGKLENWAFGCDICQEVCPWNRFSQAHEEPRFIPSEPVSNIQAAQWLDMSEESFTERFSDSPIHRAGLSKMKDNIRVALKKPLQNSQSVT